MNFKMVAKGLSLLTLASLIAKGLSAFYRIPLQNMVGNQGFYIYQQVYPIYGLCLALSLGGVPLFIAKEWVQAKDKTRCLAEIQSLLVLVSSLGFLIFFFGAPYFAQAMANNQLVYAIQANASLFLLTPFVAVLRGQAQARLHYDIFAYSQVLEQGIRVSFILLLTALGLYAFPQLSLYKVAAVALLGSFVGMASALIYLRHKESHFTFCFALPSKIRLKHFLLNCTLVSLSVSLLILLQFVDSFTLVPNLMQGGIPSLQAQSLKGIFDRGQPFIQVGLVMLSAMISGFLPLLLQCKEKQQQCSLQKKLRTLYHGVWIYGLGASLGLLGILPLCNQALFRWNQAPLSLGVLVLCIFLLAHFQFLLVCTQVTEKEALLGPALVLSVAVKYMGNQLFIPKNQLLGASVSTLLAIIVANAYLLWRLPLPKIKDQTFWWRLLFSLVPFIISLLPFFYFGMFIEKSRLCALLFTFVGVVVGGSVYLVSLRLGRVIPAKEWLQLPFGHMILKIVRKKDEN